jgi:hypothetical protein
MDLGVTISSRKFSASLRLFPLLSASRANKGNVHLIDLLSVPAEIDLSFMALTSPPSRLEIFFTPLGQKTTFCRIYYEKD